MEYIFYSKLAQPLDAPVEKPQDISNDLWRVGKVHNPNPYLYHPVVVRNFHALEERAKLQKTAILSNKQRLFTTVAKLDTLIAVNEETLKNMVAQSTENIKRMNALLSTLLSKLYVALFKNKNLEYNELNKIAQRLGVYEGVLTSIEELYINTTVMTGMKTGKEFKVENKEEVVGNIKACGELVDKLYLKFGMLKNEIDIINKEKREVKYNHI
eukprot:GAHX01002741.1.p1 GENE.GAHX01002741.1~~GAHX01002741.1.p1  ORF type:complete len:213 (+),score=47.96 GAHX01002741.1:53-691(+)